jgi:beta-glucanase (GH16 family)
MRAPRRGRTPKARTAIAVLEVLMLARFASILSAAAVVACHDGGPGQPDATTPTTPAAAQGPQGWRLTFYDEFNGPETSGDATGPFAASCWNANVTPPRCAWERGKSDPCNANPLRGPGALEPSLNLANLDDLNKCAWTVYDQFSYWGEAVARFQPDQVVFAPHPTEPGNRILRLRTQLGGSTAPAGDTCGAYQSAPWGHAGRACPIVSGALTSRPATGLAGAAQRYGRFEIRAKLPEGKGAFPAHWMQSATGSPNGWIDPTCGHYHYGEVDIMEWTPWRPGRTIGSMHYGYDRPGQCGAATDPALGGSFSTDHDPGDTRFTSGFHTYALEWEPGEVRIEVDGLRLAHYREGQVVMADDLATNGFEAIGAHLPDEAMFLILNTSIDDSGGVNLQTFANFQTMFHDLDYVRFYERCDLSSLDPACHAPAPRAAIVTDDYGMSGPHVYDSAGDQPTGPVLWSSALRRLEVLDVDGDGKDDLLLRNRAPSNHSSYLLRAVGDGEFADRVVVDNLWGMSRALWADDRRDLVHGDWNGDGCDDLLLRGRTATEATYLLTANCQGGFAPAQLVDTAAGMTRAAWATTAAAAVAGDFDGDGRDDLLLPARTTTAATYLLRGQATGGFATRVDVSTAAGMTAALWADSLRRAMVGDFDGDGDHDVLLQNRAISGHAAYLVRGSAAGFTYRQVVDTVAGMSRTAWADDLRLAHVGDVDGDGADDVLLQNRAVAESGYVVRGGAGGFASTTALSAAAVRAALAEAGHRAAVGDLDGDGRADVLLQPTTIASAQTDGRAWILRGLATGTFAAPVDVTDAKAMSSPLWAADHHTLAIGQLAGGGRARWVLQGDGTTNTALTRVDANGVPSQCSTAAPCEAHDTYVLSW